MGTRRRHAHRLRGLIRSQHAYRPSFYRVAAAPAGGSGNHLLLRWERQSVRRSRFNCLPVIGQTGALDVTVDAPGGQLDDLSIVLSQGTQTFPVLTLANAPGGAIVDEGPTAFTSRRQWAQVAAGSSSGQAKVVVSATRPGSARLAPRVVSKTLAGRAGAAGAAADQRGLDEALHQRRWIRNGLVSREPCRMSSRAFRSGISCIQDFRRQPPACPATPT